MVTLSETVGYVRYRRVEKVAVGLRDTDVEHAPAVTARYGVDR
jgi:hypothetical protein